jgi:vancomycin resistance protein YoaR
LNFKNDTGNYILIQSQVDLDNLSLTFNLYGTKDGRQVTQTVPVVTNEVAPPPDLYQDDPTLPKGEIKQTDFAAWGANVSFARTVVQNGKQIIFDKFISNYQPWQAVYLRGTK